MIRIAVGGIMFLKNDNGNRTKDVENDCLSITIHSCLQFDRGGTNVKLRS